MRPVYQLIHFVPDVLAEQRFAVAGVVRDGDGLRIARAHHHPDAGCLGGRAMLHACGLVLRALDLHEGDDIAALAMSLGPHVMFGPEHLLPSGVGDPVAWVESHVLPRSPANPSPGDPERIRERPRWLQGQRFFQTFGVQSFVHHGFDPARDWAGQAHSPSLRPVSLWAGTPERLVLIEPIVTHRSTLKADLTVIATEFAAYQYHLERRLRDQGVDAALIACVLPGASPRRFATVDKELAGIADHVVNTDRLDQRTRLLETIRRVGTGAGGELPLPLPPRRRAGGGDGAR